MKPGLIAWLIVAIMATGGCAVAPKETDKGQPAQAAIDAAAKALAEAKSLDSVWVVWDRGMPETGDAPTLEEILEAAREKQKAGELDEALRMAKKVESFARLGAEQAKTNQERGIPELR